MTKSELQKELLEKVKEGVKPSDLKKQKIKNKDEGYSSDEEKIPKAPPLPNQKIKELENQIKVLQKQLQRSTDIFNKRLETYKDFKEADLKIKERYKEEIKELKEKNQEQEKSIEELKSIVKSQGKDKGEIKEQPTNKTFFCDGCQLTKQGIYTKRKVDSPFEPRMHGRICYLCSSCSPYVKEMSEVEFDKENNPYKLE